MAKRKQYIEFYGEHFTIENTTVTNPTRNFKSLTDCYDNPSRAKIGIYNDWFDWFETHGIGSFAHGIVSYNCMQFTYGGFISLDGVVYYAHITKSYNRLYKVV